MTLILSILAGFILAHVYEQVAILVSKGKPLVINGWRLHHRLYGLVFLSLFVLTQNIPCLGVGMGVIIQHTLTDGFRFLSREDKKQVQILSARAAAYYQDNPLICSLIDEKIS